MITVNQVLDQAKFWLSKGCKEGGPDHKKILYAYNNHKPLARNYQVKVSDHWCATFVSTLFIQLGATKLIGGTECSCGRMIENFKKAGIWIEDQTQKPKPGDIVMYDWDKKDGWPEHVGIVETVDGNRITVIEGNYNNMVKRRVYTHGSTSIRGYGRPKYSTAQPVTTIAKEVIAGKWGVGADRVTRLKNAGHDPVAVQKEVNRLLA